MAKLQKIKRSNSSVVFSVNIPLSLIEEIKWEKSEDLLLEARKVRGINTIVIFKKEDELNQVEEEGGPNI